MNVAWGELAFLTLFLLAATLGFGLLLGYMYLVIFIISKVGEWI